MNCHSPEVRQRIMEILRTSYEERQPEEVHYLSMAFKKKLIEINELADWWMIYKCIQSLELADFSTFHASDIAWIYVIEGQFLYHEMVYSQGEHISISQQDSSKLQLFNDAVYAVLTHQAKNNANIDSEQRRISEQRQFIKKILFHNRKNVKISNKDFMYFWSSMLTIKLQKGMKLNQATFQDMIFVILEGSVNIEYKWKRLIKLRELGPGSVFSTYLGRYFYKTLEDKKKQEKFQFNFKGTQTAIILCFSADLFYENQRFVDYKFIVENAWSLYSDRVRELKRIIQGIGAMKPEKKEVVRNLKEQMEIQELRERAISVPIAIERRKFRKIIYNFFQQRSNRRKVPNLAIKSAKNLQTPFNFTQSKFGERKLRIFQKQRNKHQRSYTEGLELNGFHSERKGKTVDFTKGSSSQKFFSKSTTKDLRTEPSEQPQQNHLVGQFFQPEQFLSKKLRNHYQSVLIKLQKLKLPVQSEFQQRKKKFKNKKQYFEEYVNERRIVKLGPKKRLLYKNKHGF